jgi:hypothetical protein
LGYYAVWKVLDKMTEVLKKKGAEVPPNIISDLKSAKTLLRISKADCIDAEAVQRIDSYLQNVEVSLVSEAQKHFGDEYVDNWLMKINAASREKHEEVEQKARFVPGVPRGEKWIRVKPSKDLSNYKLAELAEELGLPCTVQKDGYILVYGKEDTLKQFVKKMTSAQKSKTD